MMFTWFDWIPIGLYFLLLIVITVRKKREEAVTESSFLLSGRTLTIPAFVATLVSTWYGGILGVGEYTYQFGVSQWLLFGFPFYIFAAIYAWFLASRIREHDTLSIPEALKSVYGNKAGYTGAVGIFVLVSPAPYILMLGLLMEAIVGGGNWLLYSSIIAIFSAAYVSFGGFEAVVRTDILQIILMYGGFLLLIGFAWFAFGSPIQLISTLPESYLDFTGGHTLAYIFVWFFIALWTFVDPGFHQRAAAAATPEVAKKGIFISIAFWFVFDVLTLTAGLYAFAMLSPNLANPIMAFPELASQILPVGLLGLFVTSLIAVIMSTLDSFLFLSGQTLGRDVLKPVLGYSDGVRLTKISIYLSAILGIILIILFPSVIELWYVIGSLIIPALLLPVLGVYLPFFQIQLKWVTLSMLFTFGTSLFWMMMGILTNDALYSYAWLGIEPFYPGLAVSVSFWIFSKMKRENQSN